MPTTTRDTTEATSISGVTTPDSKLAREATELVRDTESPLLFNHSTRVYYFGALAGKRRGLKFDPELLYTGAMFHDMGLMPSHSSADERFEVDGANAARDFLRSERNRVAGRRQHQQHDGRPTRPGAPAGHLADREVGAFRPGSDPGAAHARQGLGCLRHLHGDPRHHPLYQGEDFLGDREADA